MAQRQEQYPTGFPPETQQKMPGIEKRMEEKPKYLNPNWKGSEKLKGKVALITGGDSGIGRAVAVLFAREGADISIVYLHREESDARETKEAVEKEGRKCLLLPGDICDKKFCEDAVKKTVDQFKQLDILVNHAGVQYEEENIENISVDTLETTFKTNVFSQFYFVQAALPYLKEGASIINTSSVNAYKGNQVLIDYSATKGANRAFTYSIAQQLAPRKIRVNAVAPGPIWTPFIPSTFPAEKVEKFGQTTLIGRAGQPEEVAPSYLFLASDLMGSYFTGQTLHPNGGKIIDG